MQERKSILTVPSARRALVTRTITAATSCEDLTYVRMHILYKYTGGGLIALLDCESTKLLAYNTAYYGQRSDRIAFPLMFGAEVEKSLTMTYISYLHDSNINKYARYKIDKYKYNE